MIDASFLPTEILIKIFLYLDFYNIQAVRLCCTRWLEITNRPEFISKRIFKITGGLLGREHPAAKVISVSKIENLCLENIYFSADDEIFEQIGPNIKTLTLSSMDFVQDRLLTFKHFTNLQSLKVCGSKLRNRRVKNVEYPPFSGLSRLKELELDGDDSGVEKYFLGCSLCADFMEKLTLKVNKKLEVEVLKILDKAETLKILDLYFCGGSDRDLDVSQWKRIASKLSLNELSLKGDFSCDIVVDIVKNLKSLRSLNLQGQNILDDEHLTLIVQELPQLERLFLVDCLEVTDMGVGQLAKLSKLTVLGLEYCSKITSDGIRSMIGQEARTRLQELHMRYLRYLDMDALCYCVQNLQHLRVLDLCCCDIAVSNKSVKEIFEYQRNLRDLCLDECEHLADFGMLALELERLSLRDCRKLSDKTLCGII